MNHQTHSKELEKETSGGSYSSHRKVLPGKQQPAGPRLFCKMFKVANDARMDSLPIKQGNIQNRMDQVAAVALVIQGCKCRQIMSLKCLFMAHHLVLNGGCSCLVQKDSSGSRPWLTWRSAGSLAMQSSATPSCLFLHSVKFCSLAGSRRRERRARADLCSRTD